VALSFSLINPVAQKQGGQSQRIPSCPLLPKRALPSFNPVYYRATAGPQLLKKLNLPATAPVVLLEAESSSMIGPFLVQDAWKAAPRTTLNYGVRVTSHYCNSAQQKSKKISIRNLLLTSAAVHVCHKGRIPRPLVPVSTFLIALSHSCGHRIRERGLPRFVFAYDVLLGNGKPPSEWVTASAMTELRECHLQRDPNPRTTLYCDHQHDRDDSNSGPLWCCPQGNVPSARPTACVSVEPE